MMEGAGSVVQIPQTQKPVAQTQWHEAQLYEGSTVRRSMNLYMQKYALCVSLFLKPKEGT